MGKAHVIDSAWALLAMQRFILACIVVAVHLSWFLSQPNFVVDAFQAFGGKAAVIGFLFISGFSIAASIDKQPHKFYARRLYRIYPLYIVAIIGTAALEYATPSGVVVPRHNFESLGLVTAMGNFVFLQTIVVSAMAYNVAVWSLSIEVAYYALAPLFSHKRINYMFQIAAVLSAVSFVAPTTEAFGPLWFVFTKLKLIKYFWCWYAGFYVYNNFGMGKTVAFMAIAATMAFFSEETPELLAPLLIAAVISAPLWINRLNIASNLSKLLNYLGDLSYALYLFHLPTIVFVWHFFGLRSAVALSLVAMVTSVFVMHLIEYRIKPKFLKPLLFKN